jgi:hypothetical protein
VARSSAIDYAGATGRLELGAAAALGARFVVQPKHDGCYARVHLDAQGRVERLFSRAGREFPRELVGDLLGQRIGAGGTQLVGELEVWTERANRIAATRGHRALHLFDAIRVGDRYLAGEPYRVRRDLLWRCQTEAVGGEQSWVEGDRGAGRDRASGRYTRAVAEGWRIAPVTEQRTAAQADAAWADWVAGGDAEGLVVVDLEAPLGRGKRKVKALETLDCRVVRAGDMTLSVEHGGQVFVVSARSSSDRAIAVGDLVEVAHEGWFERGATPKFARLVRARPDL